MTASQSSLASGAAAQTPEGATNVTGDRSGGSPVGTGTAQCEFESPPACTSPVTPTWLNPGSVEAREAGCRCPVMDNNHGKFPVRPTDDDFPNGIWWIREDCPMHGPVST